MYSFDFFQGLMRMPGHGVAGQTRLQSSRVLVVGMGGLGCPVAAALVYSGVGSVALVDHDHIEPSNLNRQFLYTHAQIGAKKADVAAARLSDAIPGIEVCARAERFSPGHVAGCNLVLDCTDSIDAKREIADACKDAGIPLVVGAIYRNCGQICTFAFDSTADLALTDLFGEGAAQGLQQSCSTVGVYGAHCMAVGALMASEAIRYLVHGTTASAGRLVVLNTETMKIDSISLKPGRAMSENVPAQRPENQQRITMERARDEGFTIIDVRSQEEVQIRPSGFQNIPMRNIILGTSPLPAAGKLAFLCETGNRAHIVCRHVSLKTGTEAHRYIA